MMTRDKRLKVRNTACDMLEVKHPNGAWPVNRISHEVQRALEAWGGQEETTSDEMEFIRFSVYTSRFLYEFDSITPGD